MRYTHIIWDFNGTVISDMQVGIDSVNLMLEERGISPISGVDEYREIFDFPVENYYRRLGFDFSLEPYNKLARIWVSLYKSASYKITLTPKIEDVLREINRLGISQHILSASEKVMLEDQIGILGVQCFFDKIYGLCDIYAESKIELAKRWRIENPKSNPLFIGDTVHDADTARVIGCDCILYSGGHQSRKRLERRGVPVIDSLSEVINYL